MPTPFTASGARPTPPPPSGRTRRRQSLAAIWLTLTLLTGCMTPRLPPALGPDEQPPDTPREFRGAWVATVANIDWPTRPGLSTVTQQEEARALLDRARALGLNAIIFQVRPATDALYASTLEPWSEYLTGHQGQAPNPAYDPLEFWVAEAHRRGLELHAWFNPYRARHQSAKSPVAANHVSHTLPTAVKTYGDLLWLDPGEPAARAQTLAVVADVVRRYDVDGVHIDDYFYPYPIKAPAVAGHSEGTKAPDLDFPDDPSWQRYLADGGTLSRADWRRSNVSSLVQELYRTVHAAKPWVKVGISPFGLGRPDRRPPGVTGFSQYDQLYADVELWLASGWMDYLAPQLYWRREAKGQPFVPLLDYWAGQNQAHRHLWLGLFTSRLGNESTAWPVEEVLGEIGLIRAHPLAGGHIHFSMAALQQDRGGIDGKLLAGPYARAALIPATPWLSSAGPGRPRLISHFWQPNKLALRPAWAPAETARYAVWRRYADGWQFSVQPVADSIVSLQPDPQHGKIELLVIRAIDRIGREGEAAIWRSAAAKAVAGAN